MKKEPKIYEPQTGAKMESALSRPMFPLRLEVPQGRMEDLPALSALRGRG